MVLDFAYRVVRQHVTNEIFWRKGNPRDYRVSAANAELMENANAVRHQA
jgi:hypothetical protein